MTSSREPLYTCARSRKYVDHGAIVLEDRLRPPYAQAIEEGRNGEVYTVSKIKQAGRCTDDLISLPGPPGRRE